MSRFRGSEAIPLTVSIPLTVMGYMFAGAFPILEGKSGVTNFEREPAPHRDEWDRLCREGTFRFYNVTLQSGPQGDVAVYSMEVADPTKARTGFTDSPHDRWWVDYFQGEDRRRRGALHRREVVAVHVQGWLPDRSGRPARPVGVP
jgi:hypothetical protein